MKYRSYLCALVLIFPTHCNNDGPSCNESIAAVAAASFLLGASLATAVIHYCYTQKLHKSVDNTSKSLNQFHRLLLGRSEEQHPQEAPPAYAPHADMQQPATSAVAIPRQQHQEPSAARARPNSRRASARRSRNAVGPLPPTVDMNTAMHTQQSSSTDSLSPVDATTPITPTRQYRSSEESRSMLLEMRHHGSTGSFTPTTRAVATVQETNFGRPDATVVDVDGSVDDE